MDMNYKIQRIIITIDKSSVIWDKFQNAQDGVDYHTHVHRNCYSCEECVEKNEQATSPRIESLRKRYYSPYSAVCVVWFRLVLGMRV